jgi:uncharacterized protein YjbI with pentapeptide repeats
MLAENLRQFRGDLAELPTTQANRRRCRQLLANVEFVIFVVMPKGSRSSNWVFRWTVRGLLALFPVFVLLAVQLQSLRLQSEVVTWMHHFCIIADLVLLVWFFGRLSGDENWTFFRAREKYSFWSAPFRRQAALCWMPALVLLVNFAWLEVPGPDVTTVGDDRSLDSYLQGYPGVSAPLMQQAGWLLRFNPVDLLLCTPGAWGCRYLTVTHRIVVARILDTTTFVALRGGAEADAKHLNSFEPASLTGRTLRFADLAGSELFAADLSGADLRHADFGDATLKAATLSGSRLQGASLHDAQFQGADLSEARLQGANLIRAQLQGASLVAAQLQGAYLLGAQLQGAQLGAAQMQGATLFGAHLQQGADLFRAQLQGAVLVGAELQGAYLPGAGLQGALLGEAQMLQAAWLSHVFAWRADARHADAEGARIEAVETGRKRSCGPAQLDVCDWGDFLASLKRLFEQDVPDGHIRADALERLEQNLDPARPLLGEDEMARRWSELQAVSPQRGVYEKKLAELWRSIGCAPEGAPFVLMRLVENIEDRFGTASVEVPKLAAEFLKEDCAGARGISDYTRSQLIELRDAVPPRVPDAQPPKP